MCNVRPAVNSGGGYIMEFEELPSTNDYLKQHRRKYTHGTAVTAVRQTAGKGRRGKVWIDITGTRCESLFLSVLLKGISAPLQIPVISAVSAACAISAFSEDEIHIKWPNDILINKKKVCGILCESVQYGYSETGQNKNLYDLVCGFGVNLYAPAGFFNEHGLPDASPVSSTPGFPKAELRDKIIAGLLSNANKPYEEILEYYKARCITIGNNVAVNRNGAVITAFASGISEKGELVLQNETGTFTVNAGETSIIYR
jgi:BirA family biotin operon repressor/biotin-[acetyl-CoA-carboxylase] ligase